MPIWLHKESPYPKEACLMQRLFMLHHHQQQRNNHDIDDLIRLSLRSLWKH